MKKFNLNDNFIQITEVFAAKGIHKTVDPKKTFRKRKENKEAYFGRLLGADEQRVTAHFKQNTPLSCSPRACKLNLASA